MLDVIAAAIIEFVFGLLPDTRRGRIIMWTVIAAGFLIGAAALALAVLR